MLFILLGPRANESVLQPFKDSSLFPTILGSPGHNFHWFYILGSHLTSSGPMGYGAWYGRKLLAPQGKASYFGEPSQLWITVCRGYFCLFHSYQCGSLCLVAETLLSSVQDFFRGNYSIYSCRFVVSMGRGKFRIFLCCHLEVSLWFIFSI